MQKVRNEKNLFGFGFCFFASEIISEVDFSTFWLTKPGLGPTARRKYFAKLFTGN